MTLGFAGGGRGAVRLLDELPAGSAFSRASTKSRVIRAGGASVAHGADVPVFEYVVGLGRGALSMDRAGADPAAGDFCQVLAPGGGSSASGGMLGVDLAPQFDASVRVGQGNDDIAVVYGPLDIRWMGTMAGVVGASEAGFRVYDEGGSATKLVVPRHAAGDLLRIRLHWGGGFAPHIQINGWARILTSDVVAFPAPRSVALGNLPSVGLQCPAWFLDYHAVVGRRTPTRLFAVCGDSVSAETDEAWPPVISSSWERTFGARLASEGGYVLAEGVPGREMPDWLTDSRATDSNATDVILAIGTNDVDHHVGANLAQMQADIATLVGQVVAAGKRAHVWTVPPGGYAGAKEALRLAYNAWLLAGGVPGANVIDSAQCIADPADPSSIKAEWHEPLTPNHPNDAGHVVLGNYIADLMGLP